MPTNPLHPDAEFTIASPASATGALAEPQGASGMRPRGGPPRMLLILLAVAAVAVGLYLFLTHRTTETRPASSVSAPPAAIEPIPTAPVIRDPVAQFPVPAPTMEVLPRSSMPALDASDKVALDGIGTALRDKSFLSLVTPDALVRHIVVTIDNLPRASAAVRLRPISPVPGVFATTVGPQGISAAGSNANRYTPYIDAADAIDANRLVEVYFRLYPLFQQAFVELGYPNGYFNDRLIHVIDHLLAAPNPSQPIRLTQPKVMFEFADPELEDLSAGQKIMVRVGIDNELRLKAKLREIRFALAGGRSTR